MDKGLVPCCVVIMSSPLCISLSLTQERPPCYTNAHDDHDDEDDDDDDDDNDN